MACATCHQTANAPGRNRPPGAPNWHLPPRFMQFEDLTPAELCEQLKNPKTNGQKTLEDIHHHAAHDALVKWGWSPGEGRRPPPISHEDFVAAVRTWIDSGAHCPTPAEGQER